jgi:hypothetical protein
LVPQHLHGQGISGERVGSKEVDRLPRSAVCEELVKRLELEGVRVCARCGRGSAELRSDDGATLVIPLDPVRARELSQRSKGDDVRSLIEFFLDQMAATGLEPGEVVFELVDGKLRALLSFVNAGESDVVTCTPEEGVALIVRGDLKVYATDEALAHAASQPGHVDHHGGSGGSETLH